MVQGNKVSWLLLPLDSLLSAVNKDDGNNKYGGGSGDWLVSDWLVIQ